MDISTSTISVSGRDFLYACRSAIDEKEAEVEDAWDNWKVYLAKWFAGRDERIKARVADAEKRKRSLYLEELDEYARKYIRPKTFWRNAVTKEDARKIAEQSTYWQECRAWLRASEPISSLYHFDPAPKGPSINPLLAIAVKFRDAAEAFPESFYDIPVEVIAFIATGNAVLHEGDYEKEDGND